MRLLVSWVREFVDVPATPAEIAERLALRGFEVASVESLSGGDAVIDVEVTANRPDCLSVVGLAREMATAYDLPLARHVEPGAPPPFADIVFPGSDDPGAAEESLGPLYTGASDDLRVTIEDVELCPRYCSAVADVSSAATPGWMAQRLEASGVRPISPIVDVTNYVLMELGHPMHAFDLDALAGSEIRVRRARAGEAITTLDGVSRTLDDDMLVIADAGRPEAVAGVMGGGRSEVGGATRRIAFESAYFKPASVRRTSKRLGLKTEASSRFERGADVNAPLAALRRAASLMRQIGAGELRGRAIDVYPYPRRPRTIHLRRLRLTRVLGLRVPDEDVVRILQSLALSPSDASGGWDVFVPTFRVDLLREVDLIEEVGRHYGFDRLEASVPVMTQAADPPDPRIARDQLARRVLTASGLSEAVTFGFIERRAAEPFAPASGEAALVPVANPLSAKFDTLRPSLLPGLLDAVAHNRRHGRRDVGLFEVGARFTLIHGETRGVALALTGGAVDHWSNAPRAVDFFDAKGAVELLCNAMGALPVFRAASRPYLVAGRGASVEIDGETVGVVGEVDPALVERAGAPRHDAVVVAELDMDRLERLRRTGTGWVTPLPRYPFVVRDLSIVVPDSLPAAIIRGTIQAAGGGQPAPLAAVTFFDRYTGTGVPSDSVSLSIRLTFQAADRTLTDAEVQTSFDSILAALVHEHDAVQR
jgi:phenylalanyl-tRNA synthetase beta chain